MCGDVIGRNQQVMCACLAPKMFALFLHSRFIACLAVDARQGLLFIFDQLVYLLIACINQPIPLPEIQSRS